jgi:hypothetical protein
MVAAILETLTTAPRPRSAIPAARAAVRRYGARTFAAKRPSTPSLSSSSLGPHHEKPALLTRMSTSPAWSMSAPTPLGSVRSAATN